MAESLMRMEAEARELVRIHTLAAMIDVKEKTIRDWVLDGKIPYVKMSTGAVRFHVPTIRQWYKPGMVDAVRVSS